MMNCIITYKKENGDIIFRPCKFDYGKRVGDETSMGWKVLDIHYKYNNNYYCYDDFYRMIRKSKKTIKQKLASFLITKLNNWR